jgi:hypothetical protein
MPRQADREQHRERAYRHEQPGRAVAASRQRRHLAVAIEPGKRQRHAQEQRDRRQQHQIAQCSETEDREHSIAG